MCHNKTPVNKIEATKNNTMGKNLANKQTSKWWYTPTGKLSYNNNLVNSLHSTYTPGCVHTFLKNNIALWDSAASLPLLYQDSFATIAPNQHPPKMLTIPSGQTLATTKTLCLQLNKLTQKRPLHVQSWTYKTMCWKSQSCVMQVVILPWQKWHG